MLLFFPFTTRSDTTSLTMACDKLSQFASTKNWACQLGPRPVQFLSYETIPLPVLHLLEHRTITTSSAWQDPIQGETL